LHERTHNIKVAAYRVCVANEVEGGEVERDVLDFPSDNSLPPITLRGSALAVPGGISGVESVTSFLS
jgi:hypothetical protein